MEVLIACEESQVICKAFRNYGHTAFSADLQKCSGGHPEWHIVGDCTKILNGNCQFVTQAGQVVTKNNEWDLIIAHPPCTYMTAVSAPSMFPGRKLNVERLKKALEAKRFFEVCLNAKCKYIAVENPRPLKIVKLPKQSCVVNPYEFGENWSKRTYLWLKNLPPLIPTLYVDKHVSWHELHRTAKMRSKSFAGIARAMVEQWSAFIENESPVNK